MRRTVLSPVLDIFVPPLIPTMAVPYTWSFSCTSKQYAIKVPMSNGNIIAPCSKRGSF